jgi:tRNA modification GTPase
VVDVMVEWSGIPVRLVDTAGIRSETKPVERAGGERSRRELSRSDLILWVVDASEPPSPEDEEVAKSLDFKRVHMVLNKMDLAGAREGTWWVNGYSPRGTHKTSASTGEGVRMLHEALESELTAEIVGALEGETVWIANERHAHELATAGEALDRGREILGGGRPLELGAADLHRALEALAAITGHRAGEALLDEIFARFCIGK